MIDTHAAKGMSLNEAQQFLANAERDFNAQDLDAVCAGYAPEAVVEHYTDGVFDRHVGIDEIKQGWHAIFSALPHFRLTKELNTTNGSIIVNEWVGSIDAEGKRRARGIETWWFNEAGQVYQHRLFTFLEVYPQESWRGKLHFALAHPIAGLRIEKQRRQLQRLKQEKTSS